MENRENNTILLVEDDPNDVLLIKRAFLKSNITNPIQVVDNGEEAIFYLAARGNFKNRRQFPLPVLILLDLKLPRKSGHEVLEWLNKQPCLKRIPVIVLTSSQQSLDINRAYDLGANSYLVKPVTFDNLQALMNNVKSYWLLLNEHARLLDEPGFANGTFYSHLSVD
ncbi:response regulator [candidate division KSB1 bacterium]|nr:response regulator [candidate division KSB1 bacterium]